MSQLIAMKRVAKEGGGVGQQLEVVTVHQQQHSIFSIEEVAGVCLVCAGVGVLWTHFCRNLIRR